MPPKPPSERKSDRAAETRAREAERRKRLAEALRENLRKRKAPTGTAQEGGTD